MLPEPSPEHAIAQLEWKEGAARIRAEIEAQGKTVAEVYQELGIDYRIVIESVDGQRHWSAAALVTWPRRRALKVG